MKGTGNVSIIVPTLDEQDRIERCLGSLGRQFPQGEIIVVDGGSRDATVAIAASLGSDRVRVLASERSRGAQMNAGAARASGNVLLFLHADVLLPEGAEDWIESTLADPDVVAGAFRTRTVPDAGPSLLRPLLRLADLRSRYTGLPYGDQALFVRAEVFRRIGGFAEIPLMEDLEFARRLRREGKIRTVPASVAVSGRRFLAHPVSAALSMNLFPILFRLGVSPWFLARLYGNPR